MIKDRVLIHSQLMGMGKIIKKLENKNNKRTYHNPHTANCTGSTLSKHDTGLTRTAHCAGSSANTIQNLHVQHTALAVVQTHMHAIQD